MNTSVNKYDAIENLIFSENLKISEVDIDKASDRLIFKITGTNNLIVFITPISHYHNLKNGNERELKNYRLIAGGTGVHWPELDEDLSLKGFFKEYLKQKLHTEKEMVIA